MSIIDAHCTPLVPALAKAAWPSVLLVALSLGHGCNNGSAEQQNQNELILLLWEYPAYSVSEPPVSGPVLAVWANGRIVQRDDCQERAVTRPSEGSAWSYVEGQLDDGRLNRLRSVLDSIEPTDEQYLTLDAASEHMYVRHGKEFIVIAESRPPDAKKKSIIRPIKDLVSSLEVGQCRRLSAKPDVGPPWKLPTKH